MPKELGFGIELTLHPERPRLRSIGTDGTSAPDATIIGSLPALIGMLEGRLDGDALFFSRDLSIESDTELVLALRNAVDVARIDLVEDFCSLLGPAAGPAELACRRALEMASGLRLAVTRAS